MFALRILNSGDSLYKLNSCSHSVSVVGGMVPVTGFHSVMLRPDSVKLVNPPNTTIPKTNPALPTSQYPTDLEEFIGNVLRALEMTSSFPLYACLNVLTASLNSALGASL